jgi:hypothetical protein
MVDTSPALLEGRIQTKSSTTASLRGPDTSTEGASLYQPRPSAWVWESHTISEG